MNDKYLAETSLNWNIAYYHYYRIEQYLATYSLNINFKIDNMVFQC